MRKAICIILLLLFSTTYVSAQAVSKDKISVSVDLGAGYLFGNSNLSSYGVDYRGEYKKGFSGNIKALYLINHHLQAGLKFNLFTTTGNYEWADKAHVTDNVELTYTAPQIGYRTMITNKICFDYMVGAGYMYYKSKSLYDAKERTCKKGFFGANVDMSLTHNLYKNVYMGVAVSLTGGKTSSLKEKYESKEETLNLDDWNHIKVIRADFMLSIKVLL